MGPMDKDVVRDDALHPTDDGFALDIRSHWYRSLPLTSLAVLDLAVDGEKVPENDMTIVVNGKSFTVPQLADGYDEWWYVLDPFELRVRKPGFDCRPAPRRRVRARAGHPVHPRRPAGRQAAPARRQPQFPHAHLPVRTLPMTATATTVALPKLGTTLFSFTLEMRKPGYTLEGMVDKVAELGLGPGLEMVGFQSLRGYPRVSSDVVSSFRAQCERTGTRALRDEHEPRPGHPPGPPARARRRPWTTSSRRSPSPARWASPCASPRSSRRARSSRAWCGSWRRTAT